MTTTDLLRAALAAVLLATLTAACAPPSANDGEACNLPTETVSEKRHLYLTATEGRETRGVLVAGGGSWNDSALPATGETGCAAAAASLVEGELILRPYHPPGVDPTVWVAAIASPAADFERWWSARRRVHGVRLDIGSSFVTCTPSAATAAPTVVDDIPTACAFLGRLGQGEGLYPGFLEGLLVFQARPRAVAWSYVLGYWIGRIIFLFLFIALLGALAGFF